MKWLVDKTGKGETGAKHYWSLTPTGNVEDAIAALGIELNGSRPAREGPKYNIHLEILDTRNKWKSWRNLTYKRALLKARKIRKEYKQKAEKGKLY